MKVCTRRALCAVLIVAPLALLRAQSPESSRESEVRTSATVARGVRPDLATVTLQFVAEGKSPSEAGSKLAARADSLRRAFLALGIPRDSLISASQWYWWRGKIETLPQPPRYVPRIQPAPSEPRNDVYYDTLFRAHDGIEVHMRDLSKVGAVIDAALSLRVTSISPVRFTVSAARTAEVHDSLLAEATRRVRQQASVLANANGSQLGAVRSLSTEGESSRYGLDMAAAGMDSRLGPENAGTPTTVVEPMVQISVSVFGRWLLVPKP
jgi:uncharacterized protein